MEETCNLKKELKNTKDLLEEIVHQKDALIKAMWDMLNYASIFIVLLDEDMYVKLANWCLATHLGFKDEKDIIGKCWLDFISNDDKQHIKRVHKIISDADETESKKYIEITNDIILPNNKKLSVKWFNIHINGQYNLTFSIGVYDAKLDQTEDALRSYYRDIIEKDKTMIQSIKETYLITDECICK